MLSEPGPQPATRSPSLVPPLYPFTKTQQWLAGRSSCAHDLLCRAIGSSPPFAFLLESCDSVPTRRMSVLPVAFLAIQRAEQEFQDLCASADKTIHLW